MIFEARPVSITLPSGISSAWIGWLTLTVPDWTTASEDAAEEIVSVEQSHKEGEGGVHLQRSALGSGTCSKRSS